MVTINLAKGTAREIVRKDVDLLVAMSDDEAIKQFYFSGSSGDHERYCLSLTVFHDF